MKFLNLFDFNISAIIVFKKVRFILIILNSLSISIFILIFEIVTLFNIGIHLLLNIPSISWVWSRKMSSLFFYFQFHRIIKFILSIFLKIFGFTQKLIFLIIKQIDINWLVNLSILDVLLHSELLVLNAFANLSVLTFIIVFINFFIIENTEWTLASLLF